MKSVLERLRLLDELRGLGMMTPEAVRAILAGGEIDVVATNGANQEVADQAAKIVNYLLTGSLPDVFEAPASETTQEELPGLKENVERIIEEELSKTRPCPHCGERGHKEVVHGYCPKISVGEGLVYRNTQEAAIAPQQFASVEAELTPSSGYDQILAQIKREASEVEL